jgi:hypothetical protein
MKNLQGNGAATPTVFDIPIPKELNSSVYESTRLRVDSKKQICPNEVEHFSAGWTAVAHRFLLCSEHDIGFTQSISAFGTAPGQGQRHVQERELFYFFVAGLAVLESFCYSVYATGSIIAVNDFPMSTSNHLKAVTPQLTYTKLKSLFPSDSLTTALYQTLQDLMYTEWKDIRNKLAHRVAPGRLHNVSVGSTPLAPMTTEWKDIGLSIDTNTTSIRFQWLSTKVNELLDETEKFTKTHL